MSIGGAIAPSGTTGAAVQQAQAGRQLLPLRYNTRERFAKVGQQTFAASTKVIQELPRVGLMYGVLVSVRGVVTLSAAGAIADKGPWNLINRLQLNINIGAASLHDVTGFGNFALSHLNFGGYSGDRPGVGNTTALADLYAVPVALGANTWALHYWIPVATNNGRNFMMGLINLQAPEVRCTCEITFGALTDPATLVTANATVAHIYYGYYEVPDPTRVEFPPLVVHRTVEETQNILSTGDTTYTVPRQGTLLQLAQVVTAGATPSRDSADVSEISIRFNKTDTPYRMERQAAEWLWRKRYETDPPTGAFCWDLWHAEQQTGHGDLRDAIDTEALSTLEAITTLTAGASTPSGSQVQQVRRIAQVLQVS